MKTNLSLASIRGVAVITIKGPLDYVCCTDFRRLLNDALKEKAVVIDTSGVTYFDSSAFELLLTFQRECEHSGITLSLVASGVIENIFARERVDSIITFALNRDEAVALVLGSAGP